MQGESILASSGPRPQRLVALNVGRAGRADNLAVPRRTKGATALASRAAPGQFAGRREAGNRTVARNGDGASHGGDDPGLRGRHGPQRIGKAQCL